LHQINNSYILRKKINPNGSFSMGRWKPIEHQKFLEAIIIHGNDWKSVQKYIKLRSTTQARSHAQKYLLNLRKKLKIKPTIDGLDSIPRLSHESVQKIIQEILDNSSLRNNQCNKEKLIKLILVFSNLFIKKNNFEIRIFNT